MKLEYTKLLDLYKGFEGEPGYFVAAVDSENNLHYYVKCWSGYVDELINIPNLVNGETVGLTKLYCDIDFDSSTHGLDNFFEYENKNEFLSDLLIYKEKYNYSEETLKLLNGLIELVQYAIDNNLKLLIAKDEDF